MKSTYFPREWLKLRAKCDVVNRRALVSGAPGTSPSDPGSGLQGDFRIGYYEYGLLQAAFMFGLLLGCPVFSALAKTANPFKLIGTGLGVWTVATMGCGLSPGYTALFACRMMARGDVYSHHHDFSALTDYDV